MMTKMKLMTVTLNPAIDLACSVPGLKLGEVNRVVDFRSDAGGKGVNIARLLRQFGYPVISTGFLGTENSDIFEKHFQANQIEDLYVRVPGVTRTGIKVLDPDNQTTTDLNFPGLSPSSDDLDRLSLIIEQQLGDTVAVIIAGSLPPGVRPEFIGELVRLIKNNDVKVFVDTSGDALSEAIDAGPSFIKPNLEELIEYLGRPLKEKQEILNEAKKLIERGIETVVVSLGEKGALFVEANEAFFTIPPKVEVVSTVGAGDAVVGSMAAGMVKPLSLRERARLATAVSSAVVTHAGPGLSSADEARAYENQVLIEEIIK